jgi:peptidoglycan/LPS O-acetylase OafA/YrhL
LSGRGNGQHEEVVTASRTPDEVDALDGRDETVRERQDRQFTDLLQELRVVQTGVQVLFAFLLGVPFAQGFVHLDADQRALYFVALVLAGLAVVLLLAPTAWHRILFEQGDKAHLIAVSQRLTLAGLACVGLAVIAVIALISSFLYPGVVAALATAVVAVLALVVWVVLPLHRRLQRRGSRPIEDRAS